MSIKLIDTDAQAQYQRELETYELRARELSEKGGPWPVDFRPPKRPEAMADSRDKGLDRPPNAPSFYSDVPVSWNGVNTDPRGRDPVDLDGNMQQEVEGYESKWSSGQASDATPFKTGKE